MQNRLKGYFVFLMLICMVIMPVQALAAVKPSKIKLSKSKLVVKPGKEISVRAKNRADIRVFFEPKKADCDIVVKTNNPKVLRIKKNDKYSYTIKALKKGKAVVSVFSKYNSKLKKNFTVTVDKKGETVKEKEEVQNETLPKLRVSEFVLTQTEPKKEYPKAENKKVMGLNTRGMKFYVRLEDEHGRMMESQTDRGIAFRSSDETIFQMNGNEVYPVAIGEADIIVSYRWRGEDYEFKPVKVRISDYARPVSLILNQDSVLVTSNGSNGSTKVKAIYDQYGNEMSADGGEWSFDYPDYEVVPKAYVSKDGIVIEGNGAYPTIYTLGINVTVFGITVKKNLDVVVRP